MLPRVIDGKYQLVRELGTGAMGVVYEAKNLDTSRRVAVKVIASSLLAKGPEVASRFRREAKAAGAIETQHVAQILDAGADPSTGDPYIVMELLSGEDLKQLLQRLGPLPPELALRIVAQACVGLKAAHDAGIIHRDIKSANLFLARREDGDITVKIVDFGIAKVVADSGPGGHSTELTHTGSVLGSPRYMSPEQGKGQRDVSPRSDLWSLGVVLYEMLTGVTPHVEVDGVYALVVTICSDPAPAVQGRAPWVSAECAAIVHRALQLDPMNRFASAAEMLDAIRALLPNGTAIDESMLAPISARTRLSVSSSVLPLPQRGSASDGLLAASETSLNVSQGAPRSRAEPRRTASLAAGALSLLVVGGIAAYAVSSRAPAGEGGDAPGAAAPSSAAPLSPAQVAPAEEHRVRLTVAPVDASVEIDGRATPVTDGAVELEGALGSVHQVRVVKGTKAAVTEVAITDRGAVPPAVSVDVAPDRGPRKPLSGAAATGAPQPPASTPVRPHSRKDPPPATKFE